MPYCSPHHVTTSRTKWHQCGISILGLFTTQPTTQQATCGKMEMVIPLLQPAITSSATSPVTIHVISGTNIPFLPKAPISHPLFVLPTLSTNQPNSMGNLHHRREREATSPL